MRIKALAHVHARTRANKHTRTARAAARAHRWRAVAWPARGRGGFSISRRGRSTPLLLPKGRGHRPDRDLATAHHGRGRRARTPRTRAGLRARASGRPVCALSDVLRTRTRARVRTRAGQHGRSRAAYLQGVPLDELPAAFYLRVENVDDGVSSASRRQARIEACRRLNPRMRIHSRFHLPADV